MADPHRRIECAFCPVWAFGFAEDLLTAHERRVHGYRP